MPQFLTPLRVEQVNGAMWRLLAPLHYASSLTDPIAVPVGFLTDFASVPRLPFSYWLFGGIGQAAAVVHDWLYQTHLVNRQVADAIFDEALGVLGISVWRRWPMWTALRIGGWQAYRSGPSRYGRLLNYQAKERRKP